MSSENLKVTLIIGAGGSVGYIEELSTQYITEYVTNIQFYQKAKEYLNQIYKNKNSSLRGLDSEKTYKDLFDLLEILYNSSVHLKEKYSSSGR